MQAKKMLFFQKTFPKNAPIPKSLEVAAFLGMGAASKEL